MPFVVPPLSSRRWKNKNILSGIPPCCAAGWNFSRGCAMKFHRRHAFESLPVTLVVVKIEITLNCRKLLKVKAVFLRKRGMFESCHTTLTKEPLLTKNTYSSMSAWHIPKKMPSPLFCKSFAGSSCGIPGRLNLFLQMNKTGCCEHYAPAARRFAFRARLHNSLWN